MSKFPLSRILQSYNVVIMGDITMKNKDCVGFVKVDDNITCIMLRSK